MLLAASYCSYSYSNDYIFGTTNNAAGAGYNWVMTQILPQQAGLEVTGVIYRYTAVKDPESNMVVHVQNEDAQNPGQYIFRETDDWSQRQGKTIYKLVPQPNVVIDRWGDGSIEVEGDGTVEDALVTYDYRYDPCFDPQSDPSCPNYVQPIPDIPEVDLSSIYEMNDDFIAQSEDDKEIDPEDLDEDEEDRERQRVVQLKKERLEVALGAVNSALMTSEAQAKYASLMSLSVIPETYTVQRIPVVTYEETITLIDSELPDNKRALNNLAQQHLHTQMVDLQYEQNKK